MLVVGFVEICDFVFGVFVFGLRVVGYGFFYCSCLIFVLQLFIYNLYKLFE